MVTIAVLDIIDVGRILPVLSEEVFGENIFQRVYCTLGVFHELTVAIFLVSMAVAVCVQAGKEQKVTLLCLLNISEAYILVLQFWILQHFSFIFIVLRRRQRSSCFIGTEGFYSVSITHRRRNIHPARTSRLVYVFEY